MITRAIRVKNQSKLINISSLRILLQTQHYHKRVGRILFNILAFCVAFPAAAAFAVIVAVVRVG